MSDFGNILPISFEALVGSAPDAVVVHDLQDKVIYLNQAAEALYGWPLNDIQGRPARQVFYLEDSEREDAIKILYETGHWDGELRQINRRGDEYFIQSRQQLLRDDSDQPVAVVCYNTNITELKKIKDAQERAYHVRSSSLLAGGIAHELNNALAPIMLSSAMLKRSLDDEKSRSMVSMIEKCANKGAALISDLLAFERGKGGGKDLIRKAMIERSLKRVSAKVLPDSVDLTIDVMEDLWDCRGELAELTEVFEHVMQNAIEAMPEGGVLVVKVCNRLFDENFENLAPMAKAGAYVSFVFSDSGHGIEERLIQRVAEPLFTTKEPKQGYGFGLSKSQAIVKGHKGYVVLESDHGHGTTLSLFLPAQIAVDELIDISPPLVVNNQGKGHVVLVVDDEFLIRDMILQTLEDRGYDVLTAENGSEALAVYANRINDIDIVVTNVEMPFMDGSSLCCELLKLDSEVSILVSSGHKEHDKISQLESIGLEHFIAKPYTAEDLADRVYTILNAHQA